MMHHKYSSSSLNLDLYEGLPSFHKGFDSLAEDIGERSLYVVKRHKQDWSEIASEIGRMMAVNEASGAKASVSDTLNDNHNRTSVEIKQRLSSLLEKKVLLRSFGSEDEFVKYVQDNEGELKGLIGFQKYNAPGLKMISRFRELFLTRFALTFLVEALNDDYEWNDEEYAFSINVEDEAMRLFKKYLRTISKMVSGNTTEERTQSLNSLIDSKFEYELRADPAFEAVSEADKKSIRTKFTAMTTYALRDKIEVEEVLAEDSPLIAQFFDYMVKYNQSVLASIDDFAQEVGQSKGAISRVVWNHLADHISSNPRNVSRFKKWLKIVVRYNISQIDDVDVSLEKAVHDHYANNTKASLPDTIFEEVIKVYDMFIGRKASQVLKPILKGKLGSDFLEGVLRRESEISEAVSDVYIYAKDQLRKEFRFKAYAESIGQIVSEKPKYNSESSYEDFYAELQVQGIY
jgi:hypothetical protein